MKRVWFYKPQGWYWAGPVATLSPVTFGGDEFNRHTLLLGWPALGQLVIAYRQCTDDPERCSWSRRRPFLAL